MKPEVLIYVEGGVVQYVGTTKKDLEYRLIDKDDKEIRENGDGEYFSDYEADENNINMEEATETILKD